MKAVYYISKNRAWGHVSAQVWDILDQEGFLQEHTGNAGHGDPALLVQYSVLEWKTI